MLIIKMHYHHYTASQTGGTFYLENNREQLLRPFPRIRDSNVQNLYFSYSPNVQQRVGVYIAAKPVTPENNYFELEIIDPGVSCCIGKNKQSYRYFSRGAILQ